MYSFKIFMESDNSNEYGHYSQYQDPRYASMLPNHLRIKGLEDTYRQNAQQMVQNGNYSTFTDKNGIVNLAKLNAYKKILGDMGYEFGGDPKHHVSADVLHIPLRKTTVSTQQTPDFDRASKLAQMILNHPNEPISRGATHLQNLAQCIANIPALDGYVRFLQQQVSSNSQQPLSRLQGTLMELMTKLRRMG